MYREEAIPLVELNNDNKQLQVNNEAIEILKSIKEPLVIVGVAGLYRTGKSYLLNRVILGKKSGFGIGSTINAHTKGIWMWAKPLIGKTDKGEMVNIIVLDSEGLGAVDQDSTHDCRIFALVLLLSSVFLYNSVGAIDENAISNLSWVINLTKHIHIKSQNKDIDSEEFSNYFPSFLWILRDFTLELVNEDGDSITSKNYLENSLLEQNGFSEEIDQKNRIRRLIQTFFKDRDCFTMVRPLTNEEELQNLGEKELNELRPEFTEQVVELRQRVMSFNKIKKMNGKVIDGEILSGLLSNYVDSINNGAVPNIESAWNYICKNQCKKLLENLIEGFNNNIEEFKSENFPCDKIFLKNSIKKLKTEIIEKFISKSVGEFTEEYVLKLKNTIKITYNNLKLENKNEFEILFKKNLEQKYLEIDIKLKNNEYKTFADWNKDIVNFKENFNQIKGPKKNEILINFISNKTDEVAYSFLETKNQESKILKNDINAYLIEVDNLKQDLENKNIEIYNTEGNFNSKIITLENNWNQNELKIAELKKNNLEIENDLKFEINDLKSNKKNFISEKENLIKKLENDILDKDRNIIKIKGDNEKEMALLKQELGYLATVEQEKIELEKIFNEKIKNFEIDDINKYTDIIKEKDISLKNYEEEINILKKDNLKFKKKNNQNNSINENTIKENQEIKQQIIDLNKNIEDLKEKLNLKEEKINFITKNKDEFLKEIDELNKIKQDLEKKNKELSINNLNIKNDYETEKEILIQQNELLNIDKTELKNQLSEFKKNFNESSMLLLDNDDNIEDSIKFKEEKSKYENDIINLKSNMEILEEKIQKLKLDEIEVIGRHNKEIENLKNLLRKKEQKIDELEEKTNDFSDLINENNKTYSKNLVEKDDKNKILINTLKDNIEDLESSLQIKNNEYTNLLSNYESIKKNIKEENEKTITFLDNKLLDQKNEFDDEKRKIINNYETKFEEEKSNYEEEINRLEEQIELNKINLINYDNEQNNKNKKIKNLENEIKLQINSNEGLKKSLEFQKSKLEKLKKKLEEKQLEFQNNLKSLDKDLIDKNNTIDTLNNKIDMLALENSNLNSRNIENINDLKEEIKDYNLKIKQIEDNKNLIIIEFDKYKNNVEKELSLSQQANKFNEKIIKDLNDKINQLNKDNISNKDNFYNNIKNDFEVKNNELKEIINNLKDKLSKKKVMILELKEKLNSNDKEVYNINLKNKNLQKEYDNLFSKYSQESEDLKTTISIANNNLKIERKKFKDNYEKIKQSNFNLEIKLADENSIYQKNLVIKDNKIDYLKIQNNELKADINEQQKNMDLIVRKLHDYKDKDKVEYQNKLNEEIKYIESKYQSQLLMEKNNFKNIEENYIIKIKNFENENKKLVDNNKEINSHLIENIKKNEKQISSLKSLNIDLKEKNSILSKAKNELLENQEFTILNEKKKLKEQIKGLEGQIQGITKENSTLYFENEKLKLKSNLEKNNNINHVKELNEKLNDSKNVYDKLYKDFDKLKNENKKLKGKYFNNSSFYNYQNILNESNYNIKDDISNNFN